jgi:hypothetical protein
MKLAILLLALLLAGCASQWENAGKNSAQFYADDRECQILSAGPGAWGQGGTPYESCMWERGWRRKPLFGGR